MSITGKLGLEIPSSDIIQMDLDFFPAPWNLKQWMDLDENLHLLYTWREEGRLWSYCLFGIVAGDDTAHLYKILVHPEKRGSGIAEQFWSAIIKELKAKGISQVYLEVEDGNKRATSFYQKHGFQLLRRNKAYYSNGEDALIMSLTL